MSTWDDKPNDYEHALAEIEKLKAAVAAERERCAKAAYDRAGYRGDEGEGYEFNRGYQRAAVDIEAAIRKGE